MNSHTDRVLVVGATGSVGRHVVDEVERRGYVPRALVRDKRRASTVLSAAAELVVGDITRAGTLGDAAHDVDGIVFVHGSHGGKDAAQAIDYGGVRNVLAALDGETPYVALMTAIGVTVRDSDYNRQMQVHDWKRRAERLVRRSGLLYTIVRPGWFDRNDPDQHHLVFLQGDLRRAGSAADGVVARSQIAEVLVASLGCAAANRKTLELVAEKGPSQGISNRSSRGSTPMPMPTVRMTLPTTSPTSRWSTNRKVSKPSWKTSRATTVSERAGETPVGRHPAKRGYEAIAEMTARIT